MKRNHLGTLWYFYLMLLFSSTLLFTNISNGAMVDAQICASATIISADPGLDVYGFSEECAGVSGSAVASLPGETVIFSDSSIIPLGSGGHNPTLDTLSYTVQYDWNWSITTSVSGPDEIASALVWFDLEPGLQYTTGSGFDSRQFTILFPGPGYIDWFGEIGATGYASSTMAVPEPATMLLFGSGLVGLVGVGRKKFFKKL